MRRSDDQVWAGSSSNFWMVLQAEETFQAALAAGWSDDRDDEDDDEDHTKHDLLQVVGNIGVISISGGLVNDDSYYLKYYGLTGYPGIRAAVHAAARNPDVKHILLNIDSGGGSVSGVQDTASLIRRVHENLKPVSAFTGGTMASAAYWLGSAAGKVYAADTAMVGSIGVIATHKEYSKMYKDVGVGVTVVRSGPYKALANSVEPLSKEGEAQLQALVDATSTVFNRHVASMRGRTEEYVNSSMGQGREFIGAAANDVGLVDGITTLEGLVSDLQRQYIDTQPGHLDTQPRKVGGFGATAETENTMLTDQEMEKLKAEQAGVNTDDTTASVEETKPDVDTKDAATSAEVAALSGLLEKANTEAVDLRVRLDKAETAAKEALALVDPLKAIVSKSLSTMRVALGGTAVEATVSAATLIAEHASVSEEFTKKFPSGGVAAVDAADQQKQPKGVSALEVARLNAVFKNK